MPSTFKIKQAMSQTTPNLVNNVGIIGEGIFNSKSIYKGKKIYNVWTNLLNRVYGHKNHHHVYNGCSVCYEWLNYQNFAIWYIENYIDEWQIDSPDTCCFVPKEINCVFGNKKINPYGVGVTKRRNKFLVRFSVAGKNKSFENKQETKYLGTFDTPEEAKLVYKQAKENYIKQLVEKWDGLIKNNVKQALLNFKINE